MKSTPRLKLLVGGWHLLKQVMAFGNPTAGGFRTMAEALWAVGNLNKYLKGEYGIEMAVSGHWWHELSVPDDTPMVGYSSQWNNPRAISLNQWMDGVGKSHYAPIGRIIPPGFGLPGSDEGAFINPNPVRRHLAHDMLVYSFAVSDLVRTEGVGEGHVIFWTGPDGLRWKRLVDGQDVLLGHELNPQLEEWGLIVNGVGNAVKEAREAGHDNIRLEIEGKSAGDPCYLDVFTDTTLEIRGIKQINAIVKAPVAEWQGEFCHSRGGGQRFVKALQQAIDAMVFGGRIHFNSGGLASRSFTDMLSVSGGTLASLFQQYVDNDFLPGQGVPEWLDDQRATLELGVEWSAMTGQPFEVEFDARFCRESDTIGALKRSAEWTIEVFNRAAAREDLNPGQAAEEYGS
ncbi:MAG: hypothetical protein PHS62_03220 [Patescibacteria group bacterium]|nr:hypothetical protein [Patescibacteria group bacterium]